MDAALQNDVNLIGISSLVGAHLVIFQRVFDFLRGKRKDIPVFAGGIIPDEDIQKLKKMGVKEIFVPGVEFG